MKKFAILAIVAGSVVAAHATNADATTEAMNKIKFMAGHWSGDTNLMDGGDVAAFTIADTGFWDVDHSFRGTFYTTFPYAKTAFPMSWIVKYDVAGHVYKADVTAGHSLTPFHMIGRIDGTEGTRLVFEGTPPDGTPMRITFTNEESHLMQSDQVKIDSKWMLIRNGVFDHGQSEERRRFKH